MLTGHRTRARSILVALLLAGSLAGPSAGSAAVPPLVFPVIGPTSYVNDFNAPRGTGRHQGNDLMAKRAAPVVAVEPGTVRIYRRSWNAGCMLYLFGKSGTTYYYIHLNDDLTKRDDNRARDCRVGVAYAPGLKSGQRVRAGQLIGFVGNSGDARWGAPHLHFEIRPNGRRAISPFRHLNRADRLLYAVPGSVRSTRLELAGTLVEAGAETISLRVKRVAVSRGWRGKWLGRKITLRYAADVIVKRKRKDGTIVRAKLASGKPGERVTVWTTKFRPMLSTQRAKPGRLTTQRVRFRG